MHCRAALFDIDGTLVNSLPLYEATLNALLVEEGRTPLDGPAIVALFQDTVEYILRQAFAITGEPLDDEAFGRIHARFMANYEENGGKYAELYPGVPETLEALSQAGTRLGIVTNRPHMAATRILKDLGVLHYFSNIFSIDNVTKRKPDPAHLFETLEGMAVTPKDAVMVGDHDMDVLVAKRAGVPVILVSYGYAKAPPATLDADILIDRFQDLPEAIRRLP